METIELCMYICDEAIGIHQAVASARAAGIDSVLIWDTGSRDGTLEIAKDLADRVISLQVPEDAIDFGQLETMACWMSNGDWVLRLDGDETIQSQIDLHDLCDPYYGVWKMARFRWGDLAKTIQLEKSAWPDWQFRFFRNDGLSSYVGLLHPIFETPHPIGKCDPDLVVLNHFVDPLHLNNPERVARRNRLYARLAAKAGKRPEGSPEAMRLAQQFILQEPTPEEVEQTALHVANHPPFVKK